MLCGWTSPERAAFTAYGRECLEAAEQLNIQCRALEPDEAEAIRLAVGATFTGGKIRH